MACGTLRCQRLGTIRVRKSCSAPKGQSEEQNTRPQISVVTSVNTTMVSSGVSPRIIDGPRLMVLVMCETDRNPPSKNPRYPSVTARVTQRRRVFLVRKQIGRASGRERGD